MLANLADQGSAGEAGEGEAGEGGAAESEGGSVEGWIGSLVSSKIKFVSEWLSLEV